MATTDRDLAARIDATRAEQGLTVLELATKASIPLTTLQRRLTGDGKLTVSELWRISNVLQVPAASWLEVAA